MVLHSTIATSPVNVAFFFSILNLMPIAVQLGFITLFYCARPIFSSAVNTKEVIKLARPDY
ncbi:hypothetical protein CD006_07805 [Enterobacter sp. 10-1]|nr:hypothetical protein CD006_07805 [Enterobacter sp. 10-1]